MEAFLLTWTAALLYFADKNTQAMFRAPTHTETQLPIFALLHCNGIDNITLVAVSCEGYIKQNTVVMKV